MIKISFRWTESSLLHTLTSSHPHTSTTTYITSGYLHKNSKFYKTFVNHYNSFFAVITVQHTFLGYIHLFYKRNDGDVRNTMPQLIWLLLTWPIIIGDCYRRNASQW